ncbi:hypothetical protein [Pontibacter harenae]|uniref:hypothetical protein n=1 Tax=Pontibacter harenae TaxID=2894083 RepID=UPI001E44F1F9|nr:hypothetical protein [Pontibacter harenae]MCC9165823.1 hypothetical protein [Pontibacter harenae]
MKKNIQMVVMVALLIMAAACSLFEKNIDVPQEFSLRIERAENTSPQFAVSSNVSTGSDEVENYKDDINKFEISKVVFTVSDYTGTGAPALTGDLMFAAEGTTAFKILGTVSNANLGALAASGEELTVALADETAKKELASLMQAGGNVTFQLEGSSSSTPVAATLVFKVYATMTVEL